MKATKEHVIQIHSTGISIIASIYEEQSCYLKPLKVCAQFLL